MLRSSLSALLCFATFSLVACGSTTSGGGGSGIATDTQSGTDTGVSGDTGTTVDTSIEANDVADTSVADTKLDGQTTTHDTSNPDVAAVDTAAPDVSATDTASGSGACVNDADKAILDSGKVTDATTNCAMQSMGDATKAAACLKTATGLSDGCTTCFAGILSCTFKNCLTNCMGGKSPACDQCMIDKGCNATFTTCAGVSP